MSKVLDNVVVSASSLVRNHSLPIILSSVYYAFPADVYMSVQQGTGFEPVVFQNSAAKSGSLLSNGDQLVSDGTDNKKPY